LAGLVGEVGFHGAVDEVGEAPFQAAEGFAFGLAFGAFALVVGAAFGVGADLGDRDCVAGPVQLPVPAAAEPLPYGPAGGRGQGSGAVGGGEVVPGRVAADVGDVAEDGARDRSWRLRRCRSAGCRWRGPG